MPVLPQINISPGRADVPGTQDLAQAFEAQLIAEKEQKSPVESFTTGATQVQNVVANQQKIEGNELANDAQTLENERRELALSIQREEAREDIRFTQSVKTGDLNEQLNALLNTPAHVLTRNNDTARAVAQRIYARGSDAQKEIIEQELLPVLDPEGAAREKAAEERNQERRSNIRLQNRLIERRQRNSAARKRDTKSPLEQELEQAENQLKLAETRQELDRVKKGLPDPGQRRANRAEIDQDATNFATQLILSNSKLDPNTNTTEGEQRAADYKAATANGFAAFDRTDGAPATIGGVEYKTHEEYQTAVDKAFAKHIAPERRSIVGQEENTSPRDTVTPRAETTIRPGETINQASDRILRELQSRAVAEGKTTPDIQDVELAVDQLLSLAKQKGKNPSRAAVKNFVLRKLGSL